MACLPVAWRIYWSKLTPNGAWRMVGEALQNTALAICAVHQGREAMGENSRGSR